jgi:uncharacterized protein DUF4252
MLQQLYLVSRHAGAIAAVSGLLICTALVHAKPADSSDGPPIGRIDFENANLPAANVELDLSQAMFGDLFGITDAAVAGVAETLSSSNAGGQGEGAKMAAEQLAAVRKIIGLSNKVIREARVRAYEKMTEDLSSHFEKQLRDGEWEKVVVLRKGNENARVFVARRDDSIRGVFVVAAGHGGQILVNVVCDLSPENVKNLTSAATKIGLDNGLAQEIENKFRKMRGRMGPPPQAPQPPRPPQQPKRDAV